MIRLTEQTYLLPDITKKAAQYTTAEQAAEQRKAGRYAPMQRFGLGFNPARQAIIEAQSKAFDQQEGLSEVYISIQLSLNMHAMDHCYNLCRMVVASRTEQGRESKGLHYDYGMKGAAAIARLILDLMDRHNSVIASELRRNAEEADDPTLLNRITSRITDADDKIDPFEERMTDFFKRHIPDHGECAPLDEAILLELLLALSWMKTAVSCISHCKTIGMLLFQSQRLVRIIDINPIANHLIRLQRCINIVNPMRRPIHYNIKGVVYHEGLRGKLNPKSKLMEGGIVNDLIHRVFSTRFIDYIFLKSDGKDHRFRYIKNSLLTNLPQDYTIRDSEFEELHRLIDTEFE